MWGEFSLPTRVTELLGGGRPKDGNTVHCCSATYDDLNNSLLSNASPHCRARGRKNTLMIYDEPTMGTQ